MVAALAAEGFKPIFGDSSSVMSGVAYLTVAKKLIALGIPVLYPLSWYVTLLSAGRDKTASGYCQLGLA